MVVNGGIAFKVYIINESDFLSFTRLQSTLSTLHDLFSDFALISISVIKGNPPNETTSTCQSRNKNHFYAIKQAASFHGNANVICMIIEDDIIINNFGAARGYLQTASTKRAGTISLCLKSPLCAYIISPVYARGINENQISNLSKVVSSKVIYDVFRNGSSSGDFLGVVRPLSPLYTASIINPRVLLPHALQLMFEKKYSDGLILLQNVIDIIGQYSPFHVPPKLLSLLYCVINIIKTAYIYP
jgi:hypothetical protein